VRPFRFLVEPGEPSDGPGLAAIARRAESLGFSTIVYPDHLVAPLGVIPTLAYVAASTDRIRVAPFVMNNDLRHPAVLAQDLATIDVLSGGRVDVAVGAGWNEPEYASIGLPFDRVAVRVARLAEAVAVMKGCFGDGPFDHDGEHYRVAGLDGLPKPVQRPHPPFFIGGGGRRILSLAAREADVVGLAPRTLPGTLRADPRSITIEATAEKIAWIREAAGDRFDDLELNVYPTMVPVTVTDHARRDAADLVDGIRSRTGVEMTVDELLASPHTFIGSPAGIAEKLVALRERFGISSIMVGEVEPLATVVERLAGA
jgi:probable F420-dependent oxidoreductase